MSFRRVPLSRIVHVSMRKPATIAAAAPISVAPTQTPSPDTDARRIHRLRMCRHRVSTAVPHFPLLRSSGWKRQSRIPEPMQPRSCMVLPLYRCALPFAITPAASRVLNAGQTLRRCTHKDFCAVHFRLRELRVAVLTQFPGDDSPPMALGAANAARAVMRRHHRQNSGRTKQQADHLPAAMLVRINSKSNGVSFSNVTPQHGRQNQDCCGNQEPCRTSMCEDSKKADPCRKVSSLFEAQECRNRGEWCEGCEAGHLADFPGSELCVDALFEGTRLL